MPRRHDIDTLRIIAFGLLIFYHVAMVYVSEWDFHIKSSYQAEWLQWPMIAVNRWRMPLLFAISGIAVGLSSAVDARFGFLRTRSWQLLVPLLFGILVIVPVQAYCEAVSNGAFTDNYLMFIARYLQLRPWPNGGWSGSDYGFTWNHLWYLAYLWIYTTLMVVLLRILESSPSQRLRRWLYARSGVWWIALPAALLFLFLIVLKPHFPETHALINDWYLHAQYFTVFLIGYLIARQEALWQRIKSWRGRTLIISLIAISIELSLRAAGRYMPVTAIPEMLTGIDWGTIERAARALYSWSALLAIFGWGVHLLNRPLPWLPYATRAVYPWYVLHQSLIVPLVFTLIPLQLGPIIEPLLVLAGTIAGCLLLYEFFIRRSKILQILFGLKR